MAELFGFSITRLKKTADPKQSFTQPQADDGTQTIAAGGYFGQYLDMEGQAKTEQDLIRRYREIALHPECDMAIEDIVNEAIVANELKDAIRLKLDEVPFGKEVRRKIEDEFKEVLRLMNFNTKGHDIFRRWYVDGRVYYHKVIDRESPRKGITELRYIDPRKIKKVREVRKKRPDGPTPHGLSIIDEYEEYYLFNEKGIAGTTSGGIKIAPDTISFVPSGLIDQNKNMVLSYLHKAIKPVNQLRMIEDATVIYRIARAPERRIFKIDVGNLPKVKAEQYLRDVMARYRNKLVYDAQTGEIRDDRNYMSMLEDFWLPSREGGRGTDITTLPGGQNLGEISDIEYFRSKLYRSLNVPASRLEASQGFNLGRSTEITRDELKFTKFVQRLRKKFTELFNDILRTQLILKAVITEEDWHILRDFVQYDFLQDGHFAELKESEMLLERLRLANEVRDYVGKYYSVQYVRKNILKQSDRDIEDIDNQIKKEIDDGIISAPTEDIPGSGGNL
ncbi:putative portal protein [Pelagibacter phage Mosig EXVC030M]|nr:putative portal protein [Pelagibacter phage Mosig EXVC030M]